MPMAAKADGHGPARGKRLPWFIRRTARRPATMFSHDAKASRMRDRAADSLCVQPEFSAPAPRRKELPLHTALPRRFESATMQRHSPDPDSRSEEHTSELQSLMRTSYAVFCLTQK